MSLPISQPSLTVSDQVAWITSAATTLLVCAALASTAGCVHYLFGPKYFPTDLEIRVRGVVRQSRIHEVFGNHQYAPNGEVILVEVASRTDWIRRAHNAGATSRLDGDFCDSNRITLMVRPWLFLNGELVGWPLQDERPNLPTRNEAGLYIVEGYIYVRNGPHEIRAPLHEAFRDDPAQEFYDKFDLERNPRDICIYVDGANMLLTHYYESNEVRISKDEIAAALQREL